LYNIVGSTITFHPGLQDWRKSSKFLLDDILDATNAADDRLAALYISLYCQVRSVNCLVSDPTPQMLFEVFCEVNLFSG
jgi:hypothetical protein